jgi:hypothetical protein
VWTRLPQAALLVCAIGRVAVAQTPAPPVQPADATPNPEWQYGGFVDGAYLEDPNDPANHVFRSRGTTWHVNNWYVNMAAAYAKKKATEQSRWGTELEVQEGKDDEIFGFSATAPNLKGSDFLRHIGLADVSYLAPVGKGLTVQGGIFGSLIGYDSLYAKDNFNYTRPWGADFTPYLMLGVNASYPVSDRLTATGFVVNGYWHLADANHVPSVGGQIAYKLTAKDTLKETVLWGPHQADTSLKFWRFLTDTIVEHKTDPVTVAFEYTMSSEQVDTAGDPTALWISAQLPLRWTVRGPWSVSVRPEVAWDRDGRWTLASQTIKALTATLEYKIPYKWASTILRGEYRVDDSRGPQGGFFKGDYLSPGVVGLTPTQHLFIFAAIFTFDSPAPH